MHCVMKAARDSACLCLYRSSCMVYLGLHASVVGQFPLILWSDVLVVKVPAAALSPADGLGLGEAPEENWVV